MFFVHKNINEISHIVSVHGVVFDTFCFAEFNLAEGW
jgi:hypothetical protein